MGKSPSFKIGTLKKGPWTSEEDQKLIGYIKEYGLESWRTLPVKAGLQRCGKSCRLRWRNYLRPDIKRGKFSLQEEQTIIQLHALLGNRWSAIATQLPRRTDNKIKNYWNTQLKKRLTKMGIDPITHKPRITIATNLTHMTQWEITRLEAEARLCRKPRPMLEPYQQVQNISTPRVSESQVQCFSQPKPRCLDVLQAWKNSTKQSYFKGPQTLASSLSVFESALSSLSTIQDRSTVVTNSTKITEPSLVIMNMSANGCTSNREILKEPLNILDVSKEELALEVGDILDQDYYAMEALTRGNTNDYWSHILDNLGNNSSFSSVF